MIEGTRETSTMDRLMTVATSIVAAVTHHWAAATAITTMTFLIVFIFVVSFGFTNQYKTSKSAMPSFGVTVAST